MLVETGKIETATMSTAPGDETGIRTTETGVATHVEWGVHEAPHDAATFGEAGGAPRLAGGHHHADVARLPGVDGHAVDLEVVGETVGAAALRRRRPHRQARRHRVGLDRRVPARMTSQCNSLMMSCDGGVDSRASFWEYYFPFPRVSLDVLLLLPP